MMKKKIVYLFAGLMIAATMSAAMVGCDSGNETTSSQTASTTSKTESKTESKAESTGATFTSSDKSYSFTVPEGFTETEVPAGTIPAGGTGVAFINADNVALISVSVKGGSADMTGLTKDVLEKQMQAQYPGAKISDYTTRKRAKATYLPISWMYPPTALLLAWCKALIPMQTAPLTSPSMMQTV